VVCVCVCVCVSVCECVCEVMGLIHISDIDIDGGV
jgi:hypothetical protein